MNAKEVEQNLRRYEVDGKTIECEVTCHDCPFLSSCKRSDSESLKYRPDVRSFGAELHERSTIFPLIDSSSEVRARKLYQFLVELTLAYHLKKKWNALDVAKNLGISVYKVRKRIEHLIEHKFVTEVKDGILEFSFGRDVHTLIKFYCGEFKRRYGAEPRVSTEDSSHLKSLIREYSESDLRSIISKYLALDDKFLKESGYSLRFLPMKLNRILIEMGHNTPITKTSLTKDQLEEYVKGKSEGRWTGSEDWAKSYEKALIELNVPTS